MIYTVTLNPAMDKTLEVPDFRVGDHARARLRALSPAGKGLNVALGLARLGERATACGLVGRGEQEVYRRALEREGVVCALCPVEGVTRTNTTILDPARRTTTHLREEGFSVRAQDVARLTDRLGGALARGRGRGGWAVVAFCGSLPPGLAQEDWVALLLACRKAGGVPVVDTSGPALRAAVDSGFVDTIKPNLDELGHCVGEAVRREGAVARATELLNRVRLVLVTLGADGAYAVGREGCVGMACRIDPSQVRNTVGCGDAFLAGWLWGLCSGAGVAECLRRAVAAGAASALSERTVGYTREQVERLLPRCEPI